MPQKWNVYCQFMGERIDFGQGLAITHQELSHYTWSIKMWHLLLDRLPQIEARLDALMRVCPPAEVINLQAYKDEIARLKNRPFYMPNNEPEHTIDPEPKLLTRAHGC